MKRRNPKATCATCVWLFRPEPIEMGSDKPLTPYPQCMNTRSGQQAITEPEREFCDLHPDNSWWRRLR